MTIAKETRVIYGEHLPWAPIEAHRHLFHREVVSAAQADSMGIRISSVLWERIDAGGQVLPHHHDVAEIIHITVGKVRLLYNGKWISCKAGDTFHVPAGVIHSVANDGEQPSEQISIFVPVGEHIPSNSFFVTTLVDDTYSSP